MLTTLNLKRDAWRALGLALIAVLGLGLAGCGGGGSGADEPTDDSEVVVAQGSDVPDKGPLLLRPKKGLARLGALQGAKVEVTDLHTDELIYETTTDSQGQFDIDLGNHPLTEMYRVTVRGGNNVNFDNLGTAGQAVVANTIALQALATGQQIVDRGVSVTLLSDLLAQRVDDAVQYNPSALVMRALDEASTHLIAHDMDGDGVIDYRDLLAFDPLRADHRGWLKFDWQAMFQKNSQGLSVMDMAHADNPALSDEMASLMGDAVNITLPDEDSASLVSLRFDIEGHGAMQADLLPKPLVFDASRYALAVDRSSSNVILVRATPSSGSRLVGWEGCVVDSSDPGLCRVTPDATKSVVAVFEDPEAPAANSTVLHLSSTGSTPAGMVLHETEAVITAVSSDPVVAKLDAALARMAADTSHHLYVGADLAKLSTMRITHLVSRTEVEGVVRYVVGYAAALVTEALETGSVYAPPSAISVDTIAGMTVTGANHTSTQIAPASLANADYQPGPNPVDASINTALCGAQKVQHRLVDGNLACIAGSNLPVQSEHGLTHACANGEVLVEALDGEDFCVNPADVHTRAEETAQRAATGGKTALSFTSAKSGRMSINALQQPVVTTTKAQSFKPGEVVWLVGHGKAIHMSRNVFMVDRADGRGVTMVTVDSEITEMTEESRAPMAFQQCLRDANAPECGFFQARQMNVLRANGVPKTIQGLQTPQFNLLPDVELSISPVKYPWVTFTFKINVDLVGTVSSNFGFGVLWYEFGSRGRIEVQPVFNTSISVSAASRFKRPADSNSPADREEVDKSKGPWEAGIPVFEEDLFRIDFISKIPGASTVSPVLESALRFSIGADVSGNAKIAIETSFRHVVAWDVKSEFTYYVFKSNHNLQSFKVGSRGYPGMTLNLDANGSIGFFGRAVISMGPRGILPELAMLQARYYPYKLEAMGKLMLSLQTDPARVAKQHGQNMCWAGAVSLTLKSSFDVTATIDFRPRGMLQAVTKYIALPHWNWTLYSWDGVFLSVGAKRGGLTSESNFPSDSVMLGASNGGLDAVVTADTKLECPPPSPDSMPATREYTNRSFKLESGHSIYTKTHEYAMQTNGEFVIYQWNGKRGARIWGSGTAGKGQGYAHLVQQSDGHLVLRDIVGDGLWMNMVYMVGGNTIRLAERGALEIWSKNALLWSTDVGVRSLPAGTVRFKVGEFELNNGESIVTQNRSFYLDDGTARYIYMHVNQNRYASTPWKVCDGRCRRIVLEPNGNLVFYDQNGAVVTESKTAGKGCDRAVVREQPPGRSGRPRRQGLVQGGLGYAGLMAASGARPGVSAWRGGGPGSPGRPGRRPSVRRCRARARR